MITHQRHGDFEPRWPVAITVIAAIGLLACLPDRVRLMPNWVIYVVGISVLIPILAIALAGAKSSWSRIERGVIMSFFLFTILASFFSLADLVNMIVNRSRDVSGLQLLQSSVAVWVENVIGFSLLYWQLDRGGPEARARTADVRPEWLFPQDGAPEQVAPAGWWPTFVDYLYLSFSTATAFSTTDVMPLTHRSKLLMMLESSISLALIVVVASRAINILS
jgi:hypothetical protein